MKLIYSADNHITLKTPICRTDDFVMTLKNKLEWLRGIIKKYNAIFINGGDVGDEATLKSYGQTVAWINFMLANYPECYGIYGNHDEPNHRIDYMNKALLSPLIEVGIFKPIDEPIEITKGVWLHGFHFGQEVVPFDESLYPKDSKHIGVFHGYVYEEDTSMIKGYNAKYLLYENPQYDMILTGDHHTNFVAELDGQVLINSGPLYRGTIEKIDYQPVVYLIDTDDLSYEAIPVPIVEGVISTEHKDKVLHKTNTMESVVNVVKNSEGVVLSFENELSAIMDGNKDIVDNQVREYIDIITEKTEVYAR